MFVKLVGNKISKFRYSSLAIKHVTDLQLNKPIKSANVYDLIQNTKSLFISFHKLTNESVLESEFNKISSLYETHPLDLNIGGSGGINNTDFIHNLFQTTNNIKEIKGINDNDILSCMHLYINVPSIDQLSQSIQKIRGFVDLLGPAVTLVIDKQKNLSNAIDLISKTKESNDNTRNETINGLISDFRKHVELQLGAQVDSLPFDSCGESFPLLNVLQNKTRELVDSGYGPLLREIVLISKLKEIISQAKMILESKINELSTLVNPKTKALIKEQQEIERTVDELCDKFGYRTDLVVGTDTILIKNGIGEKLLSSNTLAKLFVLGRVDDTVEELVNMINRRSFSETEKQMLIESGRLMEISQSFYGSEINPNGLLKQVKIANIALINNEYLVDVVPDKLRFAVGSFYGIVFLPPIFFVSSTIFFDGFVLNIVTNPILFGAAVGFGSLTTGK
ncbi:hypothetical protein BB558_002571 [Smittium angustum]|uniref:Uncharacterized protein n=1 Tax=Smittium angustum TaxID=133377 RepID=A0A2U1J8M6_SMIAN|nr:hypothetical protein BB558_002571 [Smittium angustum]